MIIFDTETTDLLKPDIADLSAQPHIIEIAMARVCETTYKVLETYVSLVNPEVPLDEEMHKKISKLTNADLKDQPTFLELYQEIADFYLGEHKWVAHNLEFDKGVLVCELRRIGKEYAFPFPPNQICTVNATKHLKGHRLRLVELYELKLKRKLEQKHRALSDVMALAEIVKEMKL